MSKLFYDHLVLIEEMIVVFDEHGISKEEQKKLLKTIDQLLHHEILDVILTHLPKEHHEAFLTRLAYAPHDRSTMHFLKEKSGADIEGIIMKAASKIKRQVKARLTSA